MRPSDPISCGGFPCTDVLRDAYRVPSVDIDPETIEIIMIAEAAPPDPGDDFYAPGDPSYTRTTLMAFADAGVPAGGISDIIGRGIYITTAVKCAKTGYAISPRTIENCSLLLEQEIALFPHASVVLLMGDVAKRAMNDITKRQGGTAVIPSGSTYKIRKGEFRLSGRRYLPSYLMTGGNYLIEKSKRRMIAEDIREAVRLAENKGRRGASPN
jgi:uracil-DNA glycosylase